jgi:acetone carboxylase gamma subunit
MLTLKLQKDTEVISIGKINDEDLWYVAKLQQNKDKMDEIFVDLKEHLKLEQAKDDNAIEYQQNYGKLIFEKCNSHRT